MCYMWIDGKVEEYLCNFVIIASASSSSNINENKSMTENNSNTSRFSSEWNLWVNFLVHTPWKFPRENFPGKFPPQNPFMKKNAPTDKELIFNAIKSLRRLKP